MNPNSERDLAERLRELAAKRERSDAPAAIRQHLREGVLRGLTGLALDRFVRGRIRRDKGIALAARRGLPVGEAGLPGNRAQRRCLEREHRSSQPKPRPHKKGTR